MENNKPRVAVILSGCGVFDGSEIHEAVLTLLAIDRQGAEYVCYAPNTDQAHVINHLSGEEAPETRNVLVESARIARGNIKDLNDFDAADFDAAIFPGGFGGAKNLCSFAFDGPDCSVNDDVRNAVKGLVEAGKPIGALCITPVVMAKLLDGVNVTIGQDADTAQAITKMGATHSITSHGEVAVDKKYKLATSPCYMLDATISQIAEGADNTVRAVLEMI